VLLEAIEISFKKQIRVLGCDDLSVAEITTCYTCDMKITIKSSSLETEPYRISEILYCMQGSPERNLE
jgi:hypothetical protein